MDSQQSVLKFIIGFAIVLAIFFAGMRFADYAKADFSTITSCSDGDYEVGEVNGVPVVSSSGDTTVTNVGSDKFVYLELVGLNASCDNTTSAVNKGQMLVTIPEDHEIGIKWESPTRFRYWDFTDNEIIQRGDLPPEAHNPVDFTSIDPAEYAGGFVFRIGVYGGGIIAESPSFSMSGGTQPLKFQAPPFVQNFTSPDFKDWWVCVNLPSTHTYTGYKIEIAYGLVGDAYTMLDDTSAIGTIPITPGRAVNECPLIGQLANGGTIEPGEYNAQAYLYDQDGNPIYETSVLHFTITTGDEVLTPPTGGGTDGKTTALANCITDGGIVDSIYEVGCKLVINLFYPSATSMNKFTELREDLETKAPFSYFYQVYDGFSELSGTAGTIPTLEITTGTATPIDIDVDLLSPTTISQYYNGTLATTMRTLMQVVLYLAFISFILYESRKLFNKQQ